MLLDCFICFVFICLFLNATHINKCRSVFLVAVAVAVVAAVAVAVAVVAAVAVADVAVV